MTHDAMEYPTLTLLELNTLVQQCVSEGLPHSFWVTGELLAGSVGGSGHFCGELVEKDEAHSIVARAKINIWMRVFTRLRFRFEEETGQTLRAGLKLLLLVDVSFHEVYGYSLTVRDIDSSYTLGDLAQQRRKILQQLEEEGILRDNQTLTLPRLLNRIAIVSSDKAAGYGDFCNQLLNNDYGLRFTHRLFPAIMQGQHTVESVLQALTDVAAEADRWDVVVIIRGGGATSDLADFESYDLAAAVAQFPIPVIVGIGHERDETVLDFVAHTRVKTPTAAAAFLVDHQREESRLLDDMEMRILGAATMRMQHERQRLDRIASLLPLTFARMKERVQHRIILLQQRIDAAIRGRMQHERSRLQLIDQHLQSLDPRRLLRLGYSITLCNGRLVRDAAQLKPGDELTTQLEHGTIQSTVK